MTKPQAFKLIRDALGLTQRGAATAIDVDKDVIDAYESGWQEPEDWMGATVAMVRAARACPSCGVCVPTGGCGCVET